MRRLLAHRDARLYLAGQSLSLLGDTALWLALAVWAKELTGSNAAAGLVILCIVAPGLAAPVSGLLVDRVRRRSLLLVVNPLTALAVLPLLAVHGPGDAWIIYAVSILYGVSYTLLGAGQSALLATMLDGDLLAPANAFLQTVREGLRLVAPVAGAGLYTLAGGATVALLDAATFLIAAATLLAMRFREPPPATGHEPRRAALTAGARHLARTPALRRVVLALGCALAVLGLSESLLFAIPEALHRPPAFAGVLMVPQGAGALLGALSATRCMARRGERALAGLGLSVSAIGVLAMADAWLPAVLAGKALYGFGLPWAVIGMMTLLQRSTPGPLQGRAFAAAEVVLGVPQTLSIALGAALVGVLDYRILLAVQALGLGLAGVYLLTRRPVAAA